MFPLSQAACLDAVKLLLGERVFCNVGHYGIQGIKRRVGVHAGFKLCAEQGVARLTHATGVAKSACSQFLVDQGRVKPA